ncbi:nuclear transport factor 2 family protein [Flavobacterium zepuense]|uniref:Nuclear transport factor 2 family protein n=1 Tax=Flavobacterium zepuense TaxID=2593302 RepID=A0A552V8B3_9FLAO|nr:nuclear transport factor 2 family protein [Flavobacterium zepuense]TRW26698.1 nuclear transport factor 2 family protein [Flavobacterium zepuense]
MKLRTKETLRELVDAYALLGDEKKISEQMSLFTPDAVYTVYMNGIVVADIKGTDNLQKEFNGHASAVKTYFTLNGQHNVKISGDSATGTSFSTIKMIREHEGKDIITDYSVRYDDTYIFLNNKWLIAQRIGHFIIVEARPINN